MWIKRKLSGTNAIIAGRKEIKCVWLMAKHKLYTENFNNNIYLYDKIVYQSALSGNIFCVELVDFIYICMLNIFLHEKTKNKTKNGLFI